jgi:two-component system sensor histidine kinase YesM
MNNKRYRRFISKYVNYYDSLMIRKKLVFILSILILSVTLLSALTVRIYNGTYDNQLIDSTSETLNTYSTHVENELRKIDKLTYSIISDTKMQNYLNTINSKDSSYEKIYAIDAIKQTLLAQSQAETYIASISLVDQNGGMYTFGNSVTNIEPSILTAIIRNTRESEGGLVWIDPMPGDRCVIAGRSIRATNNLQDMATVIIRIDMNSLINWVSSMSPKYKANLIILSDMNNTLYKDKRIQINDSDLLKIDLDGKKVQNFSGQRYLVNRAVSNYSKWSYVYFLSYENIFKSISGARTIMFICFVIIFVCVMAAGIRFANSITNPIIALSKKMKKVENGDFNFLEMDKVSNSSNDEIGQLNNDFIIMINKINTLINENYIKQILIKETQLKALQAQINPHFLYNTLESINWKARASGQTEIATMVKSLGNLLRSSINNKEDFLMIEHELNLVKDYISIQKIRFENRLEFIEEVDSDIKKLNILKLTLQPIVENSINYGVEFMKGVCRIKIKSIKYSDYFDILVIDNGPGMDNEFVDKLNNGEVVPRGNGVGLNNINERIKLFFGEQYGLIVTSIKNEETVVRIRLPY